MYTRLFNHRHKFRSSSSVVLILIAIFSLLILSLPAIPLDLQSPFCIRRCEDTTTPHDLQFTVVDSIDLLSFDVGESSPNVRISNVRTISYSTASNLSGPTNVIPLDQNQSAIIEHNGQIWIFKVSQETNTNPPNDSEPIPTTSISDIAIPSATSSEALEPKPTDVFTAAGLSGNPFGDRDGTDPDIEVGYLRYLLSGIALNNTVIIVPTNTGFIRLALNLNCHLRKLGINNLLFWALDRPSAEILHAFSIPVYYNPSYYSTTQLEGYHSEKYIKMMAERPKFWRLVMQTGRNMLFLDADVAVISNPLQELIGDADLEAQIDEKELWRARDMNLSPQLCAGAFLLKSNERTLRFLDQLENDLKTQRGGIIDDQEGMNLIIHDSTMARILNRFENTESGITPIGGFKKGVTDERLSVRFVPVERYLNGHVWGREVDTDYRRGKGVFMRWKGDLLGEEWLPALLHLNGHGFGDKEHWMKHCSWWYIREDGTCKL